MIRGFRALDRARCLLFGYQYLAGVTASFIRVKTDVDANAEMWVCKHMDGYSLASGNSERINTIICARSVLSGINTNCVRQNCTLELGR